MINNKTTLRLSDRLTLTIDEKEIRSTLRWWILNHTLVIYNHIYRADANKIERVEINKDAHQLLMKEMASKHPNEKKEIELRRKNLKLVQKIKSSLK